MPQRTTRKSALSYFVILFEQNLTPDEFNNLYDASVQRPSDFAQLHSYDWFMDYVMLVRRNSYVCCSSLLAFNQFHLMVSLTTLC